MLQTSIPPQSPVAWSNFINGAGPGSHGIFDFIHRDPSEQCAPFFAVADTVRGEGFWKYGNYNIPLEFWPFNHKPPHTELRRMGVAFWEYLDKAGISSTFYNLPSNYPASASKYGHHQCLSGMGTPDLIGTYGTYQYFSEDVSRPGVSEGGGKRSNISFENETARARLIGPDNTLLAEPEPSSIDFLIHRDKKARAAVIEIAGKKILLNEGGWSNWQKLAYVMSTPAFLPDKTVSGICRFYLQSVEPVFRLYVSPINTDPSDPAIKLTEPDGFIKNISKDLGLFYTTGFQEDHKALSNRIFTDDEFMAQATKVLEERLTLLDYALKHYDDGLLFFYFSSTDLQSHMFWWDTDSPAPTRTADAARYYFSHIQNLYIQLDGVVGDIVKRYGKEAWIVVMSDHGFARFARQFNLNAWLRENGYLYPRNATSLFKDVDWAGTRAYGLGINSLYLNLRGREIYGSVRDGQEKEILIRDLIEKLQNVKDSDGMPVIRTVHRADKVYSGAAAPLAPDLVVGYYRPYRASWSTCLGGMEEGILSDNDSAWCADHCADVQEVPGILFSNRPIASESPALIDLAPSVLTGFGLPVPSSMEGKNIF